jgi:hypothetical protein
VWLLLPVTFSQHLRSRLPVLARALTRQSFETNAGFSRACVSNQVLKCSAAFKYYLCELSDQLDVTLESSTVVELALSWVATTQSDAITDCIKSYKTHCTRDRGEPALGTAPALLQESLPRQVQCHYSRDRGEPALCTGPALLQAFLSQHCRIDCPRD